MFKHYKLMMWKWKLLSCVNSLWPHGLYSPWNFPGQNTGVGSCSLLQGLFPTQGSNPGLPHCRDSLSSEPPGNPMNLWWAPLTGTAANPACFKLKSKIWCGQCNLQNRWITQCFTKDPRGGMGRYNDKMLSF